MRVSDSPGPPLPRGRLRRLLCAIYCRLSKEDEDKHLESESIQNQKSLLVKYAVERGWEIYQIFCDEDYSGVDRERPAFGQLIADARQGKFDLVLVKTQSRFTRDMELVEKYIHGLFPIWGIRFVAVVDHVDTDVKGNKKARQINGLINEWYLEDLSENIRTVFEYKRRAGQYIGAFPVYGYQKSPTDKNKLVIDPEAAQVVRHIFALYLEGNGKQQIASLLNQEGRPNPTRYKQMRGLGYTNAAQSGDLGLWNRTTVGRMLRDQMYTGDMVQGRRKKVSYKSKYVASVPREEWMVVEGTHEAIIDRETFETVRRMLEGRTRSTGTGQIHALAGKVRCMDCGSVMVKVSNTYNGERRSYLRCKRYAADKRQCGSHSVRLDALEREVVERLRQLIGQYYDQSFAQRLLMSGGHDQRRRDAMRREAAALTQEVERRGKAMRDLYLDKSRGLLDEEQFAAFNQGYLAEKTGLQTRLALVRTELSKLESNGGDQQLLQEKLAQWLAVDVLSRELVGEFVDCVRVGQRDPRSGRQPIEISWLI